MLSHLVSQFNRIFIQKQREWETIISTNKITEQRFRYLKREWNLRRERQVALVRAWGTAIKEINNSAGVELGGDYYEDLPPLE